MHHRCNQCVSQLSCTKSQPIPSQFSRGTWCIANAINAFHGFLAPSLGRFWGNSPGGLGASPTQSMRFTSFLHQVSADSEAILLMNLVHHQRNQCVSRLSCTKSQPIPRQFSRGTGASPTKSMRFQVFLHQISADSEAILPGDLVHHRRNQCVSRLSCTKSQPIPRQFFWGTWCIVNANQYVSRLSCTKSQPIPRQFFRGTWCITDAINAFHVFLAPGLSRFRANSSGGLGASPTQSMRFQAFLHQVSADSEAKSRNLHPESNPILKM